MYHANQSSVKPRATGLRSDPKASAFDRLFATPDRDPAPSPETTTAPDASVDAFARLVAANKLANVKAMLTATRELRSLGYSVVIVPVKPTGGVK